MTLGELLGSGRSADLFAIDDQWVVRRYRDGHDTAAEAVVMAHLAAHGFPVPQVGTAARDDGTAAARSELVMERLYGPSMLQALQEGTTTAETAGATLAELLNRLHAVPARVAAGPGHRVLHLDLHPENVILTPDGPMVIDWRNTEEGPPGLDWAMSALILAQVTVAPDARATLARSVLASVLRHRDPLIQLGDAASGCLSQARQRRATDPNLTEDETGVLDDALALVTQLDSANTG